MNGNAWALGVFMVLDLVFAWATARGQGNGQSQTGLRELRQRLASLEPGMSSDQVLKVMGKPDEVRRVPENHLLDGIRLLGERGGVGPETERWVYGATGKGLFARVGYVSMDRNGKVVGAVSTDDFAGPGWKQPEQVPASRDEAVASPAKLSCHAGAVKYDPKAGETAQCFETTITLKNAGTGRFERKHDAATSPRRFLLVEVYDSTGTMLFRDDQMRYGSPLHPDPAHWPTLSISPGKEISVLLFFSPSQGFGPLPPGKYSLRVYFPFEEWRYYPSNLVRFEAKERVRIKGQKKEP